ncbi:MAG: hypothetical protein ACLRVN_05585 [Butyricicoccus sp.]
MRLSRAISGASDIKEINLGEIDLGSVHTGTPISMSIKDKLPSGVSLVSGQPETANVTISVDGVATRKVQVSKFAWNDTAQENTPYKVAILTKSVEMELRGSESQLQKVDVNNLSIGLTYDWYRSASAGTRSRAWLRPSVCRAA